MDNKTNWLILGPAALLAAALIAGCATTEENRAQQEETPATANAAPAEANKAAEAAKDATGKVQEKPGRIEGGLYVVAAKVKAIDKKNRVVTLNYPNGKEEKIKYGPEARNFTQIRKGDLVAVKLLETLELYVTGDDIPSVERTTAEGRAPLGAKQGFAVIDSAELSASVEAIDYLLRELTLKNPEGKLVTMTAGPEVKRLSEVKKGDTVVVRLVRARSIEVSKPAKQ